MPSRVEVKAHCDRVEGGYRARIAVSQVEGNGAIKTVSVVLARRHASPSVAVEHAAELARVIERQFQHWRMR